VIRQSCLLITDLSHLLLHRCTVVFAAHDANTYSDQIFRSLRLDQNGAMLLEVVALTRNERDTLLSVGEPDEDALPVGRIWLFWFLDHGFQNDSF